MEADTKLLLASGSLYAKDHTSAEAYWDAVIKHVLNVCADFNNIIVVCEDYLLYATKLQDQINSRMETPKLIGVLQYMCFINNIPYYMQTASEVKNRWSNEILLHKGIIRKYRNSYLPTSGNTKTYTHHSLDAIRHAIHFITFRNGD